MRKPDQVLENKEIVNKILEGIHFGYYIDGIPYKDPNSVEKRDKKQRIADELFVLLKKYKHCAEGVTNLSMTIYEETGRYVVYLRESFGYTSSRNNRLILYK